MSQKPHHRFIFLIIATNNTNYFNNARRVWKEYLKLFPNIKAFFIYGKLDEPLEDRDVNDLVFEDVFERHDYTTIQKNLIGMKYIDLNYSYDYLIRTNLSTFWNLNLVERILEKCPPEMCYAGGHDLSPFIINGPSPRILTTPTYSGVCLIFTPDIIELFLNNLSKFNFNIPDDIALGLFLSDVKCNTHTTHHAVYFENYRLTDDKQIQTEIHKAVQNQTVYYRVKNNNNRELTDLMIYKYLLKEIYGI